MSKKPKKVIMEWVATRSYYPKYTCPSCHTNFEGGSIGQMATRFRCDCGQELIITRAPNLADGERVTRQLTVDNQSGGKV